MYLLAHLNTICDVIKYTCMTYKKAMQYSMLHNKAYGIVDKVYKCNVIKHMLLDKAFQVIKYVT